MRNENSNIKKHATSMDVGEGVIMPFMSPMYRADMNRSRQKKMPNTVESYNGVRLMLNEVDADFNTEAKETARVS